jgi:hypothetical protein
MQNPIYLAATGIHLTIKYQHMSADLYLRYSRDDSWFKQIVRLQLAENLNF